MILPKKGNRKSIYILLLITSLSPAMSYGDTISKKAQEGIAHYQQQKYDKAAQSFQEAIKKQPDNSTLEYNLANSKYKSGKYEESLGSYAKTISDNNLKQQSVYNTGNALYRMGKLEEAASAYKKALELNPNDIDSKFNLEFTREQIKKKMSKPDQDKQNQKSSDPEKNQQANDPAQNQDPKDPGKKDQPNKDQDQSESGKREAKPDHTNPSSQAANSSHAEMNKEEAEQWLRSLEENPRKFAHRQIQDRLKNEKTPVGNDW